MTRMRTIEITWIISGSEQMQKMLRSLRKIGGRMLKPITLIFLLLMISSGLVGQDLDEDCRPILLPVQCQTIAFEISRLDRRIAVLEYKLRRRTRRGEYEQDLADQINELKAQRRTKASELARCRRDNTSNIPRRQVAASELDAIFIGRVTAETTEDLARGPFFEDVRVRLRFSRNRCVVTVTEFPPIVFETEGDVSFTITVTKIGGGIGNFFPVSGNVNLPIKLKAKLPLTDSTASATLTTGNSVSANMTFNLNGKPLMIPSGSSLELCSPTVQCPITLVGTTVFQGGLFVAGDEGSISITGNIVIPQSSPPPNPAREECLQQCEEDFIACGEERTTPNSPPRTSCQTQRRECVRRCRNR